MVAQSFITTNFDTKYLKYFITEGRIFFHISPYSISEDAK